MRIPDPGLSLKAVADYFAIPRVSDITDGLQAQFLYADYRACREREDRARLKTELVAYNRDDLEATAAMVGIMRDGPDLWPAAQPNRWEEQRTRRPIRAPRMRPRLGLTPRRLTRTEPRGPGNGRPDLRPEASADPLNPLNLPF